MTKVYGTQLGGYKIRYITLLLVSFLLHSTSANAQFSPSDPTVNTMYGFCHHWLDESEDINFFNAIKGGVCSSVISTSVQLLTTNCESISEGYDPDSTLTVGYVPSIDAAVKAFIRYAEKHFELRDEPWLDAIIPALSEAFPCRL